MPSKTPGKFAYGRIVTLDRLLRQDRFPPVAELAKQFGISSRTVERDLEALRDYFGAPVEYNRSARTYRYTDSTYRLPAITLTQEELVVTLVVERLLRQYAGTPFEPVVLGAFNKLTSMLPEEACLSVDVGNLCKAMVFEQGIPIREYSLDSFVSLLDAIAKRKRTEISYYTVEGNREIGTRFVDPYHLANWGGEWYLVALCLRRKQVCNFHLQRVKEVYALDLHFDRPQGFDAQMYMARGFGIIAGDAKERVRLQILVSASRWVKEKVWHFSQRFEKIESDGSFILCMDAPADQAGRECLRRWVLQFGSEAVVMEPAWLKREIKEHLERALTQYSG